MRPPETSTSSIVDKSISSDRAISSDPFRMGQPIARSATCLSISGRAINSDPSRMGQAIARSATSPSSDRAINTDPFRMGQPIARSATSLTERSEVVSDLSVDDAAAQDAPTGDGLDDPVQQAMNELDAMAQNEEFCKDVIQQKSEPVDGEGTPSALGADRAGCGRPLQEGQEDDSQTMTTTKTTTTTRTSYGRRQPHSRS